MAFTRVTTTDIATNGVQAAADVIANTNGQVNKLVFDRLGTFIATTFNTALTKLESTGAGTSGADNIGSAAISGVTGTTVRAQIADLKTQLSDFALGAIADGSLTAAKFSDFDGDVQDAVLDAYEIAASVADVSSSDTLISALGKLQKSISSLKTTYEAYIAAIAAGTTIAKKAEDVTTSINGNALTSIFETNGTTVKNATNAVTSTTAGSISDVYDGIAVSSGTGFDVAYCRGNSNKANANINIIIDTTSSISGNSNIFTIQSEYTQHYSLSSIGNTRGYFMLGINTAFSNMYAISTQLYYTGTVWAVKTLVPIQSGVRLFGSLSYVR